jgi:hypothetical protein
MPPTVIVRGLMSRFLTSTAFFASCANACDVSFVRGVISESAAIWMPTKRSPLSNSVDGMPMTLPSSTLNKPFRTCTSGCVSVHRTAPPVGVE